LLEIDEEIPMLDWHTYDLGFVPHEVKPEIVFIIKAEYLEPLEERLPRFVHDIAHETNQYFQPHGSEFVLFEQELFDRVFGHGRCGRVTREDDEVWLRIELGRGWRIYEAAYTINVLSRILSAPFSSEPTNHSQQLDLHTRVDRTAFGWGHMLNGYLSGSVVRFLREYAASHIVWEGSYWCTPMHREVIEAMRCTWRALGQKDLVQYSNEADGVISQEGRFILKCFGNACDIAIYPDTPMYEEDGIAQFSCHNLDHADQQLTLLAGLAKLLELARQSE
jgi:hypothetical protein